MACVLVVDDEKGIRVTFGAFLRASGCDVCLAETAAEARAAVEKQPFDVAVVDVVLGRENGCEFAAEVRKKYPHTQVILITGEPDIKSSRRAILMHAFDYLVKPVGKEQILDVVKSAAAECRRLHEYDRLREVQADYQRSLEREVAERTAEIKYARDQAQQYLDVAGAMLIALDPDQRIIMMNRKGCEILGLDSEDQAIGKNWFDEFIEAEDFEEVKHVFDQIIAGDVEPVEHYENPVRRASGELRYIAWYNSIIRDVNDQAVGILSSGQDITERKTAELRLEGINAQLADMRKMDALGRLSAGISHEYNNILMGIVGYVHHLRKYVNDEGEGVHYLGRIRALADQATNLSRRLLDFSRATVEDLAVTSLDELIRECVETFDPVLGEDIEIDLGNLPDASVEVDAGQMREVLINLVLNACDAMPEGGKLWIDAELLDPSEAEAEKLRLEVGRHYVVICVEDEGTGMSDETMKLAIEPFFTTKPVGKGTGLGLSSSLGIVKAHNGALWLESEEGKGTTVKIYLPLAE